MANPGDYHYVMLWTRLVMWMYHSRTDAGREAALKFRWHMWRERRREGC